MLKSDIILPNILQDRKTELAFLQKHQFGMPFAGKNGNRTL